MDANGIKINTVAAFLDSLYFTKSALKKQIEKLNEVADLKDYVSKHKQWIDSTWEKVDNKLKRIAIKSRNKIPYTTINGEHDDNKFRISWWTNGFWEALMWLMYKGTGNEEYKITALQAEKFLDKAFEDYQKINHDVGFMWHISAGVNYRITGDLSARNRNLLAAAILSSRYNIDGEFIRCWNTDNSAGWTIIDSMMNLPILYWASKEVNDPRFKRVALKHANMVLRDHIRDDGSINHIVEHDTETGEKICAYGGQGYDENSCWSRGEAWAVYGTILSYIYTQDKKFLDAAIKTANYFVINCQSTDFKTVVDFRAPHTPVYYDSTAGVCAACGLLELSKYVSDSESKIYFDAAINILKATDEFFCDYSENDDALVKMGTERYPHDSMDGVHIPIIYGDYFYVEALLKLRNSDFIAW